MFNIMVWCVYGLFVGSIAKSIVPGEENFGFWWSTGKDATDVCGRPMDDCVFKDIIRLCFHR